MAHSFLIINENRRELNPVDAGWQACPKGHSYGPAVREYWLLHYVLEGEGRFEIEGKTFHLKAGEIFVIPPQVVTYYEADQSHPWKYVWIGFTHQGALPKPLDTVIRHPEAGAIFEEIQSLEHAGAGKNARLTACLWRLFSLLLEETHLAIDPSEADMNIIRAEYMNELSVEALARRLHLHRSTLSVLFRKKYGLPLHQCLTDHRMHKASELLSHGFSVTTTATSVGYADIVTFSKRFKLHFGCSPKQYAKKKADSDQF